MSDSKIQYQQERALEALDVSQDTVIEARRRVKINNDSNLYGMAIVTLPQVGAEVTATLVELHNVRYEHESNKNNS